MTGVIILILGITGGLLLQALWDLWPRRAGLREDLWRQQRARAAAWEAMVAALLLIGMVSAYHAGARAACPGDLERLQERDLLIRIQERYVADSARLSRILQVFQPAPEPACDTDSTVTLVSC